jgi:hypothetical protein
VPRDDCTRPVVILSLGERAARRDKMGGSQIGSSFAVIRLQAMIAGCTAVIACGSSDSRITASTDSDTELSSEAVNIGRDVRAADSTLLLYSAREAQAVARAGLPPDARGLIGRNREWGEMYAARFQMGAGGALRMALLSSAFTSNARDVQLGFAGVEAGLRDMDAQGRPSARVPLSVSMGREPTPIDVASGAAFYLGDACLGMLALEAAPDRDQLVPADRRRRARTELARSIRWLTSQATLLMNGDADAPNRLLFDARAYLACGALANDASVGAAAGRFVQSFRAAVTPAGWIREGNGWDTSYQAVSLDIGMDVAAVLPPSAARSALLVDLTRSAAWLATRVQSDGRVDSAGNSRTCSGGESFFGSPKTLAVNSVVIGLARVAVLGGRTVDSSILDASRRTAAWRWQHPDADTCFERMG